MTIAQKAQPHTKELVTSSSISVALITICQNENVKWSINEPFTIVICTSWTLFYYYLTALFRQLVPRIAEIKQMRHVENDELNITNINMQNYADKADLFTDTEEQKLAFWVALSSISTWILAAMETLMKINKELYVTHH